MPVFTARKTLTVLVVGSRGVGKTTLGEAMAEHLSQYTLEIRTCSKLPLDDDPRRPRIDFVVFLVSMTDAASAAFVRDALESQQQLVDAEFYFGRSCVVASHADLTSQFAVDPQTVHSLARDLETVAHMVSLADRRATRQLVDSLVEQAAIAARHAGASAPLVRSIDAAAFAIPTM